MNASINQFSLAVSDAEFKKVDPVPQDNTTFLGKTLVLHLMLLFLFVGLVSMHCGFKAHWSAYERKQLTKPSGILSD